MTARTVAGTGFACRELASPVGPLGVAATDVGLVALSFGGADQVERVARRLREAVRAHAAGTAHADPANPGKGANTADAADVAAGVLLEQALHELGEYFAGVRTVFEVPVDWRLSTGFNRRALTELHASVRYGETIGYGALAQRLTDPAEPPYEAARAVGRAMAGNPVAIVVPCHRVVASSGDLHGFGGGLEAKRRLLALEGVLPRTFDDLLALG